MVDRRCVPARRGNARIGGLFRASNARAGRSREVTQQVGGELGRAFFGDEVADRHWLCADLRGAWRAPQRERVEPLVHCAAFAPQHQRVAGNLVVVGARGAVVVEVDAGRGAVVLATGVQRIGPAEANAVYTGSNDFTSSSGSFKGVTLSSIPKSSLLGVAPTTAGIATFTQANSAMGFTPQGITNYGTGYTGSKVIAVSATAFNKVQVTAINNTAAAGATLGATQVITVAHDGNGTLARQPNGSRIIDTLDDRISGTVQQVGNRIYATNAFNDGNQGGNTAPGFNSVHWMVIDATTGALLQEGLLQDASHDDFQPSIAANENGDVVIGYNKSGANMNISSFAAIGHTVAGVLSFTDDVLLATRAVGNYTDGFNSPPSRWGDYSATMVDPTDSNVFWTIQELASDERNFGTQITAIRLAAAVPEPETYALMLAGLAALGMVARRRKAV